MVSSKPDRESKRTVSSKASPDSKASVPAKPNAPEEPPVVLASEPDARLLNLRRRGGSFGATTWIAGAMLLATLVVGIVVAVKLVGGGGGDTRGSGGRTGFATACDGVAQEEISIGRDATTHYSHLCFRVTEHSTVTIDATPDGSGADLQLTVALGTGKVLAEDDDTKGMDPEVVFEAEPGTYLLNVTEWGGAAPGAVRVHSSAIPIPEVSVSPLPTLGECESLSNPIIEQSGAALLASGDRFTCLHLATPAFTKIDVRANDPSSADLTLAVYAFDASGAAQFVRSVDDTFGTDPELNLDLGMGTFLIEVGAYEVAKAGAYSVYVDTTGTYFRTDAVSSGLATLLPSSCASLPSVALGVPLAISDGQPMACLTVDSPRRLVIMAATHADQDLTLEIVGFDSAGSPVSYVWADEDVFGADPNSQDPRVDLVLPAGTYVLAVDEYWGAETAHDFVLTAAPGGGPTG